MSRLVLVCGPSCVGKSPLSKALTRLHPQQAEELSPLVLFNSREPRPGERDGIDYHFRPRSFIEKLRSQSDYLVVEARSDLQAVHISDVLRVLQQGTSAFFEGNPYVGKQLILARELDGVEKLTLFVSPLSMQEVLFFKAPERHVDLENLITDLMRRKLLRRTQKQKGILSLEDLKEIEVRATSAFLEMQQAWRYQYVLPNHDGEDSENWNAFYYPIADARKLLEAFAVFLRGEVPALAEKWEQDLLSVP